MTAVPVVCFYAGSARCAVAADEVGAISTEEPGAIPLAEHLGCSTVEVDTKYSLQLSRIGQPITVGGPVEFDEVSSEALVEVSTPTLLGELPISGFARLGGRLVALLDVARLAALLTSNHMKSEDDEN